VIPLQGELKLLGLVSWTFVCGEEGMHPVFANVGVLGDWLQQMTHEFSLPSKLDFGLLPQGKALRQRLTITNYSDHTMKLMIQLQEDSSDDFRIDINDCAEALEAGVSCSVWVEFLSHNMGYHHVLLEVWDLVSNITRKVTLQGEVLEKIAHWLSNDNLQIEWFKSVNSHWTVSKNSIFWEPSTDINNHEFLVALFKGSANISFELPNMDPLCNERACLSVTLNNRRLTVPQGSTHQDSIKHNINVSTSKSDLNALVFGYVMSSKSKKNLDDNRTYTPFRIEQLEIRPRLGY
jgi:hypothetical protein